jgi:ribosomal protein S14
MSGVPGLVTAFAAILGVSAVLTFARTRAAEDERRPPPTVGATGTPPAPAKPPRGRRVCPTCGAVNAVARRTCAACRQELARHSR